VQGQTAIADADLETQREVIDAFLAAARKGGFEALLEVLDPDVVLRADRGAVSIGASRVVRGATSVAARRSPSPASISRCGRRSSTARPARSPLRDLRPFAIAGFTIRNRTIVEMDVLADSERLSQLDLTSSTDHCHIVARIPTPGPLLRLGSSSAWPRAATACARARSPMRRARGRDGWGGSRCRSGRRR
jgi:RNA polymerase sigma-70 factor (ECF subfamily)